jgi:hypothetical protein
MLVRLGHVVAMLAALLARQSSTLGRFTVASRFTDEMLDF